ncbi:MAG: mandelate racemase/muconate lactonizing enzyme family protein [Chloroflexi bacterium]|nr:mandelate racemase/muconate lactonizing enzyme family protein [Chloroflexota bacterium]
MKITAIKPYPAWSVWRNVFLVKVETDEGIYGWGEGGTSWRELGMAGVTEHFSQILIGKDPMQPGRIWQELYRSAYFEGGRVITGAMSAIDIALHDIIGKKLGVPVYQLLGGKQRDWVPCFATTSAPTAEEMIESAGKLMEDGWECMRLSVGERWTESPSVFEPREDIPRQVDALIRARAQLGRKVVIGIDYHHRLSVAEAASFCQAMPPGTLDFVEEPIRDESVASYETLRQMTPIPFALGEEFSSKWQFLPYIEKGLTNYARVDMGNVGGFTEAQKVAGWCEAHYIDLMPHNPLGPINTAASAHLAMATPNFAWLEMFQRLEEREQEADRLYPGNFRAVGGRMEVPDRPGLGIDVDEDAIANSPMHPDDWIVSRLVRRDGSVTNW